MHLIYCGKSDDKWGFNCHGCNEDHDKDETMYELIYTDDIGVEPVQLCTDQILKLAESLKDNGIFQMLEEQKMDDEINDLIDDEIRANSSDIRIEEIIQQNRPEWTEEKIKDYVSHYVYGIIID